MIRGPSSSESDCVRPEITQRGDVSRETIGHPRVAPTSRAICSGAVPQQPPSAQAPSWTIGSISRAKSSGVVGKTVLPSITSGRLALGCTKKGSEEQAPRVRTLSISADGSCPQLRPTAVTPSPSSMAMAPGMSAPVSRRPRSSKVRLTNRGSSAPDALRACFAPSTHALTSARSVMVSISKRSGPSSMAAEKASWNRRTASSKGRSPYGASRRPDGPMSAAT